jgi:hypothetical protein
MNTLSKHTHTHTNTHTETQNQSIIANNTEKRYTNKGLGKNINIQN